MSSTSEKERRERAAIEKMEKRYRDHTPLNSEQAAQRARETARRVDRREKENR